MELPEICQRFKLVPFWAPKLDPVLAIARVDGFFKKIYSYWAPKFNRYIDSCLDKTEGPFKREIECLHEADLAIHSSGERVDRGDFTERNPREMRRKEAYGLYQQAFE